MSELEEGMRCRCIVGEAHWISFEMRRGGGDIGFRVLLFVLMAGDLELFGCGVWNGIV